MGRKRKKQSSSLLENNLREIQIHISLWKVEIGLRILLNFQHVQENRTWDRRNRRLILGHTHNPEDIFQVLLVRDLQNETNATQTHHQQKPKHHTKQQNLFTLFELCYTVRLPSRKKREKVACCHAVRLLSHHSDRNISPFIERHKVFQVFVILCRSLKRAKIISISFCYHHFVSLHVHHISVYEREKSPDS